LPFFFREWLRKNILRGHVPDPPPMVQEGVGLHYKRLQRSTRAGRTPPRKTGGEKNTLTGNCEGRANIQPTYFGNCVVWVASTRTIRGTLKGFWRAVYLFGWKSAAIFQ